MRKLTSNKLFYRRYPYKLVLDAKDLFFIYSFNCHDIRTQFPDVKTRFERSCLTIFCLDAETFDALTTKFLRCALEAYSPASEQEAQYLTESNTRIVLCDKFPHDRYQYKIYFKYDTPGDIRQNFSIWLKKYCNRTRMSIRTIEWLKLATRSCVPFICVDDSNMVSMIGLFMYDHIKYMEHFVLRSSINTETNEETQICQP